MPEQKEAIRLSAPGRALHLPGFKASNGEVLEEKRKADQH